MEKKSVADIYTLRKKMRIDAVEMAETVGGSGTHLGGSFSAMDIIAVLYGGVLNIDRNDPGWQDRDRLITSKRHCYLASYSALFEMGMISKEQMLSFHKDGGDLAGYPWKPEYGIDYSGGSLGMGLSVGVGMALAARRNNKAYKCYVLLGDGECDEGSIWEAVMSAAKYGLENLIVIIDHNGLQFDGECESVMPLHSLKDKFLAFGWEAAETDGHNIEALLAAFQTEHKDKPLAIIAHTIKGYGLPSIENKAESHHTVLAKEDREYLLKQIEEGVYDHH